MLEMCLVNEEERERERKKGRTSDIYLLFK